MNWLDVALALIIGGSVIAGLMRGFARVFVGIVAAILGLILAAWFYGTAGGFLTPYVSHKSIASLVGFLLVFCGVLLCGAVAAKLLGMAFRWVGLGWLDRLLGGALGLVRGVVVAVVVVMVLMAFTIEPPPRSVVESAIAPYVIDAAGVMAWLAPRELKDGFARSQERVRKAWMDALARGGVVQSRE